MGSSLVNDKELYTCLGLLSDEIHRIKELLGRVSTRESEMKAILDELTPPKQNLADRICQLESMIKQAAEAAISEADQEKESNERLEKARAEAESQLREKEEILQVQDAIIKELEDKLRLKSEDLEKEITQKTKLLEVREVMLTNLSSTTKALNVLAENLKSLDGTEIVLVGEAQQKQAETDTSDNRQLKDLEERMAAEMDKLMAEIRERDVMIGAKEAEVESIKQTLGARIEELESLLKRRPAKRRPASLVSYFGDYGRKD